MGSSPASDEAFLASVNTLPDQILCSLSDRVLTIEMLQPRQTVESEAKLLDALVEADGYPGVRVIVLTGRGTTFCAGADLSGLAHSLATRTDRTSLRYPLAGFGLGCAKPVVAAINGGAGGMGLVYALACDIRFASANARFSTAFARRGLAAERSLAWLLPRVIGLGKAMDLALSARKVTAEEALRIGLVDHLLEEPSDVLAAAQAWAKDVATNCSPTAVAVTKRQILQGLEVGLKDSLRESNTRAVQMLNWTDAKEGVASYLDRRPPEFEPNIDAGDLGTAVVEVTEG